MASAVTPFEIPRVLASAFHCGRQERYAVHDENISVPAKAQTKAPPAQKKTAKVRSNSPQWKRITPRQVIRLTHRLAIMCAALFYISASFQASIDSIHLLNESMGAFTSEGAYTSDALGRYIGTTTLRESPFVVQALGNDTSPRNGTIYYDLETMSFEVCDTMSPLVRDFYTTGFLRYMFAKLSLHASYNLTFLAEENVELIVPLVDCSNYLVTSGDDTMANLNFLVRKRNDPDDVYMLTFTFVNQAYKINSQNEYGPAAVGTLSFINDLRATHVDSYYLVSIGYPFEDLDFRVYELVGWSDRGSWLLQVIPTGQPGELVKIVRTGTRSGFYMISDSDQTNIFTEHWEVSTTDPIAAITGPTWFTKASIYDAWAWTHLLQLAFGLSHLSSLAVLGMVSYQNFLAGKLWIGDAFVAVSGKIHIRGALVLVSWYINGFWAFYEFCLYDANLLTPLTNLRIYESIILADLLTIYLTLCGLLGAVFRERIDPLLALISFAIGFGNRHELVQWFPKCNTRLAEFFNAFYSLGTIERIEAQKRISPMRVWNTHELKSLPADIIVIILIPIFCTLLLVLLYIAIRKVHRYFYPDPLRVEKASSITMTATTESKNSKAEREQKSVLTLFEIATGAKLANRFGLLAEYDNCLFIKGMKFATPDGVYSNGFVIANKKYLIQADGIWSILRVRYKNLYMYEVNGSTVEQVARLIYPSTFSLADLLNINTSILS